MQKNQLIGPIPVVFSYLHNLLLPIFFATYLLTGCTTVKVTENSAEDDLLGIEFVLPVNADWYDVELTPLRLTDSRSPITGRQDFTIDWIWPEKIGGTQGLLSKVTGGSTGYWMDATNQVTNPVFLALERKLGALEQKTLTTKKEESPLITAVKEGCGKGVNNRTTIARMSGTDGVEKWETLTNWLYQSDSFINCARYIGLVQPHTGVDVAKANRESAGSKIYALLDGRIIYSNNVTKNFYRTAGHVIIIDHGYVNYNGNNYHIFSQYLHLYNKTPECPLTWDMPLSVNTSVKAGQQIGVVAYGISETDKEAKEKKEENKNKSCEILQEPSHLHFELAAMRFTNNKPDARSIQFEFDSLLFLHQLSGFIRAFNQPPNLTISPTDPIRLLIGQTQQLTALVNGNSVAAAWTSNNSAVATVSTAGLVTAVAVGTTTITATYQGATATANINVASPSWSGRKQFGNPSDTNLEQLVSDETGNLFLFGDAYGPIAGTQVTQLGGYLAKYTSAGSLAWAIPIIGFGSVRALAPDGEGGVYMCGYTSSINSDAFAIRYSSSGSIVWTRQLGTTSEDGCEALAVSNTGQLYLTGSWEGIAGPSNKAFLASLDKQGNFIGVVQSWNQYEQGFSAYQQVRQIGFTQNSVIVIGGLVLGTYTTITSFDLNLATLILNPQKKVISGSNGGLGYSITNAFFNPDGSFTGVMEVFNPSLVRTCGLIPFDSSANPSPTPLFNITVLQCAQGSRVVRNPSQDYYLIGNAPNPSLSNTLWKFETASLNYVWTTPLTSNFLLRKIALAPNNSLYLAGLKGVDRDGNGSIDGNVVEIFRVDANGLEQ